MTQGSNGNRTVFRVNESPRLATRHSGAARNPEGLGKLPSLYWQGFLNTGESRYDGLGIGNPFKSEQLPTAVQLLQQATLAVDQSLFS